MRDRKGCDRNVGTVKHRQRIRVFCFLTIRGATHCGQDKENYNPLPPSPIKLAAISTLTPKTNSEKTYHAMIVRVEKGHEKRRVRGAHACDRTHQRIEIGRKRGEVTWHTRVDIMPAFTAIRIAHIHSRGGGRREGESAGAWCIERIRKLQDFIRVRHKHPVGEKAKLCHALHGIRVLLVIQQRL